MASKKIPSKYKNVKVIIGIPEDVLPKFFAIWTIDRKTMKPTIFIEPDVIDAYKDGRIPYSEIQKTLEHEYQEALISIERLLAAFPTYYINHLSDKEFDNIISIIGGKAHDDLEKQHPEGASAYREYAYQIWKTVFIEE